MRGFFCKRYPKVICVETHLESNQVLGGVWEPCRLCQSVQVAHPASPLQAPCLCLCLPGHHPTKQASPVVSDEAPRVKPAGSAAMPPSRHLESPGLVCRDALIVRTFPEARPRRESRGSSPGPLLTPAAGQFRV